MAIALAVLAVPVCLGIVRPAEAVASTAAQRQAVAHWWAPVHFQDVDTSGETSEGGKSDYLAAYNFDGDLNGRNNWESITESPLAANVWYSMVEETEDYGYLLYTFFHPRDWADGCPAWRDGRGPDRRTPGTSVPHHALGGSLATTCHNPDRPG
ncbi:hypothetical protein SUDANB105_07701 [Streptomyces sp. enrichment culture]|uniref:hypothetical protein n=1 Tax=Streptomyces sp. enrichment culture TaxID=1795815 RepID=UPI003F55DEAE